VVWVVLVATTTKLEPASTATGGGQGEALRKARRQFMSLAREAGLCVDDVNTFIRLAKEGRPVSLENLRELLERRMDEMRSALEYAMKLVEEVK
jgi:hypothetical protein